MNRMQKIVVGYWIAGQLSLFVRPIYFYRYSGPPEGWHYRGDTAQGDLFLWLVFTAAWFMICAVLHHFFRTTK